MAGKEAAAGTAPSCVLPGHRGERGTEVRGHVASLHQRGLGPAKATRGPCCVTAAAPTPWGGPGGGGGVLPPPRGPPGPGCPLHGKHLASGMRPRMDFWDAGREGPMVPPFTAVVRAAVWDTVAGYVHQQLLLRKGVRIPTLGSFDTIPERLRVRARELTVQRPVFRLARNLADAHQLTDDKAYLPGDKLLEPLRYAQIAAATFVSAKRVVGCIQATMSLFSRCIGKGRSVALILKDIGMLLIEGTQVQMKYYRDFLETMTGKDTLKEALLRVPGMLDLVIPRTATAASLTCSGRVIIFPEFELETGHGTPLRDYHNKLLNECRQKKAVLLRPRRQDKKERLLSGANTSCPGYTGEQSLEPGSLSGKQPPPEETPTGHQHPAGSTAPGNSSRRKGPNLKRTSLAMRAFLQPGERRRE